MDIFVAIVVVAVILLIFTTVSGGKKKSARDEVENDPVLKLIQEANRRGIEVDIQYSDNDTGPSDSLNDEDTGQDAGSDYGSGEFDYWYGWDYEASVPTPATLEFDFMDVQGNPTHRRVDIDRSCFQPKQGTATMHGYCHLREGNRQFFTGRVRNCTDTQTGEVIEDIPAYLQARYETTGEFAIEHLASEYGDLLDALIYVAKADGRMVAAERAIIVDLAELLLKGRNIPREQLEKEIRSWEVVSTAAFKIRVGKVAKNKRQTPMLKRATELMLATKKAITPSEQESADYITSRIQREAKHREEQQ